MTHPLKRLFRYATPYRGRLVAAVAGMLVYAAGAAGLAALVRPILDNVLVNRELLAFTAWALVGVYLLKGIGSYVSSNLMADVGQRVVTDLRNALYRHILGQSAGFFAQRTTGQLMSRITNDVGQVQQAVSETVGDLTRESLALVGYAALMFYLDARRSLCTRSSDSDSECGGRPGAVRRRSSNCRTSAPKRSADTVSSKRSARRRTRLRNSAGPAISCSERT